MILKSMHSAFYLFWTLHFRAHKNFKQESMKKIDVISYGGKAVEFLSLLREVFMESIIDFNKFKKFIETHSEIRNDEVKFFWLT